ncbi:hypothetical protein BCR44DRAFT_1101024 [Catenaria anguillulae PL171]|uniref:TmcB/TmcC TPR repeats domain-containing protein n=1 Tax=Catenaria anguillulae PL171 TaxID=765915 RepID=A0A1Y2I5P4_9FUNG|nr:hypothetical protein BCR44DRAFT_1101024 [Catenaria anguillulae PL171]
MALRDIWESFRVDVSDGKLADAIAKLSDYERGAEECYQRLLERNSKDVTVLRLFSMFLNCVKGDKAGPLRFSSWPKSSKQPMLLFVHVKLHRHLSMVFCRT